MNQRERMELDRHRDTGQEGDGYADDMCPNCVTPWKCNGPHLETTKSRREADLPPAVLPDPELLGMERLILALIKKAGGSVLITQRELLEAETLMLTKFEDFNAHGTRWTVTQEARSEGEAPPDRNVSYLVEVEKLKQQLARKQMDVDKLQRQLDVAILKLQLQRTAEQRADGLLLDAIATDLFPGKGEA